MKVAEFDRGRIFLVSQLDGIGADGSMQDLLRVAVTNRIQDLTHVVAAAKSTERVLYTGCDTCSDCGQKQHSEGFVYKI